MSYARAVDFGNPKCPCVGLDNVTGATTVYLKDSFTAEHPADIGAHCEAWDNARHPSCKAGAGPSFCKQNWCFVDPCNCDIPEMPKMSLYLKDAKYQGKPIYYSYATCGGVDEFVKTDKQKSKACVDQSSEEDCQALDTCAWSKEDGKCGGKEAMGACTAVDLDAAVGGIDGCQCIGFSNRSGITNLILDGKKIAYPADV